MTACSTGTSASIGSSAAPAAAAPTASPSVPTGEDAKSGPFPCNVFSLSDIKAATGYRINSAKPIAAVNDPTKKSCAYVDTSSRHSLGILTQTSKAAAALQFATQIEGTGGPVTGIGDSAWGDDNFLGVVFGDQYVQVADTSDSTGSTATSKIGLDTLKTMVKQVHAGM